jgi:hypothetical protein
MHRNGNGWQNGANPVGKKVPLTLPNPSIPGYVPAVMLVEVARKIARRDDPDYWENF